MSAKNLGQNERDSMLGELAKKETEFIRFRRLRLTHNEFENIKLIGRGAFGEVRSAFRSFFPPLSYFFTRTWFFLVLVSVLPLIFWLK